METVQQIVPISDLKLHHARVLGMLGKGPVVLAQRSKPRAVLVSVEEWDRRAEELKRLRRMAKADQALAEMRAGNYIDVTEEVMTWKEVA